MTQRIDDRERVFDHSGDRNYFTMVPNYVLDHSTAIDLALYVQMKRIAGDGGECFFSKRNLKKILRVGYDSLNKSLSNLVEKEWITYSREVSVMTNGGVQTVSAYTVNNIWKLNCDNYEKGAPKSDTLSKGAPEKTSKVLLKSSQGAPETAPIKNNTTKNSITKNMQAEPAEQVNINPILEVFASINPAFNFGNTTQRKAIETLVTKIGYDETLVAAQYAISIQNQQYAPSITTPVQLKDKMGQLIAYKSKEDVKLKNSKIGIV